MHNHARAYRVMNDRTVTRSRTHMPEPAQRESPQRESAQRESALLEFTEAF
jgi:hypothetical protein